MNNLVDCEVFEHRTDKGLRFPIRNVMSSIVERLLPEIRYRKWLASESFFEPMDIAFNYPPRGSSCCESLTDLVRGDLAVAV